MNIVLFVNTTIGFSENLFLVNKGLLVYNVLVILRGYSPKKTLF